MTNHVYCKIGSHMWLHVQDRQSLVHTGAENNEPNVTLKQASVRYPPSHLNWLCPYRPSMTSLHDIQLPLQCGDQMHCGKHTHLLQQT